MVESSEPTGNVEQLSEPVAVWQESMRLQEQLQQLTTWAAELYDKPDSELSPVQRRSITGQFIGIAATAIAGLDVLLGPIPSENAADLRKLMISVLAKIDPVSGS